MSRVDRFIPESSLVASETEIEALLRISQQDTLSASEYAELPEYSLSTQQYDGLTAEDVKRLLAEVGVELSRKMVRHTNRLLDGQISLAEWHLFLTTETKKHDLIAILLGVGGLSIALGFGLNFWEPTQSLIRSQFTGITRTAERIGGGEYTPKQLLWYANYKGSSVVGAYNQARKTGLMLSQFNEARRWPDPAAEHCIDCPAYSTGGLWVPTSDVVPIGVACRCNGRCRCRIEYRFNPERALQMSLSEQINRAKGNESQLFGFLS
ncbi:MAG: hypothetical protein AAGA46_00490 [Cyanobacteria bacterium P01_F01_bin.13]